MQPSQHLLKVHSSIQDDSHSYHNTSNNSHYVKCEDDNQTINQQYGLENCSKYNNIYTNIDASTKGQTPSICSPLMPVKISAEIPPSKFKQLKQCGFKLIQKCENNKEKQTNKTDQQSPIKPQQRKTIQKYNSYANNNATPQITIVSSIGTESLNGVVSNHNFTQIKNSDGSFYDGINNRRYNFLNQLYEKFPSDNNSNHLKPISNQTSQEMSNANSNRLVQLHQSSQQISMDTKGYKSVKLENENSKQEINAKYSINTKNNNNNIMNLSQEDNTTSSTQMLIESQTPEEKISKKVMKRHERNLYPYLGVHFKKSLRDDSEFLTDLKQLIKIQNPVWYINNIISKVNLKTKQGVEAIIKGRDYNVNIAFQLWVQKYLKKSLEKSKYSKNDHISQTHLKRKLAFESRSVKLLELIQKYL